jgi:hypothetical protein
MTRWKHRFKLPDFATLDCEDDAEPGSAFHVHLLAVATDGANREPGQRCGAGIHKVVVIARFKPVRCMPFGPKQNDWSPPITKLEHSEYFETRKCFKPQ